MAQVILCVSEQAKNGFSLENAWLCGNKNSTGAVLCGKKQLQKNRTQLNLKIARIYDKCTFPQKL
jgi:hypothetical protein